MQQDTYGGMRRGFLLASAAPLKSSLGQDRCAVCLEVITEQYSTPRECKHKFCVGCLEEWAKVENSCPCCRQGFSCIHVFGRIKTRSGGEYQVIPVEDKVQPAVWNVTAANDDEEDDDEDDEEDNEEAQIAQQYYDRRDRFIDDRRDGLAAILVVDPDYTSSEESEGQGEEEEDNEL